MNQEGFSNIIVGAVILLLVIIATGGYFLIQQNKTAVWPNDYVLKADEVPLGFQLQPIPEGLVRYFADNPGFIDNEIYRDLFKGADPLRIEQFFVSLYIKPEKLSTQLGIFVIKYKSEEDYNFDVGKIKNTSQYEDAIFLKNNNILVMVWSDANSYRSEARQIADKLKTRLGLQEV